LEGERGGRGWGGTGSSPKGIVRSLLTAVGPVPTQATAKKIKKKNKTKKRRRKRSLLAALGTGGGGTGKKSKERSKIVKSPFST